MPAGSDKVITRPEQSLDNAPEGVAFLPEAERNYLSAGIGYALGRNVMIDLGYQAVLQSDRRGRVRSRTIDQTAEEVNVGVFSSDAHVFALSLVYGFGSPR